MDPELPGGWEEVDRNDEFSATVAFGEPGVPASKVYEGPDGQLVIVQDELDKPIEYQDEPRYQIEVVTPEGVDLYHGHSETTNERAEAAVSALAYMATHCVG